MTTDQALQRLLCSDDYLRTWLKSGRTKQDRAYLRHRFLKGKLRSETKESLLQSFGFEVKTVQQWSRPTTSKK